MQTKRETPNLTDRLIIFLLTKVGRIRFIIEMGIMESYDQGYKKGFEQSASIRGKKYKKKVQKAMKQMYEA